MSLFDLIIGGALIAIVFALIRANDVLGNNPHQQVKALEDLVGPFPTKMSFAEKLRLNNLYGISPTNPRRARCFCAFLPRYAFATAVTPNIGSLRLPTVPIQIIVAVSFVSTTLAGCAVPGFIWSETNWEGPLAWGSVRAKVMKKCDSGPSGFSDVTNCKWAFVDHRGTKVDASEDVQKLLDDFMPQVEILKPWVMIPHDGGSLSAPERSRVPYRLHIVTVSPVVLLAVPIQHGETDYCAGPWVKQGCIPSRRFSLEPYWYKKPPRAVEGAFWIAPCLGVKSKKIESATTEVFIPLPDSRLRLQPKDGFWAISREPTAGRGP